MGITLSTSFEHILFLLEWVGKKRIFIYEILSVKIKNVLVVILTNVMIIADKSPLGYSCGSTATMGEGSLIHVLKVTFTSKYPSEHIDFIKSATSGRV